MTFEFVAAVSEPSRSVSGRDGRKRFTHRFQERLPRACRRFPEMSLDLRVISVLAPVTGDAAVGPLSPERPSVELLRYGVDIEHEPDLTLVTLARKTLGREPKDRGG